MAQAFPKENHPPGAPVSILEGMNAFIADVKFSQNFKGDIPGVIP